MAGSRIETERKFEGGTPGTRLDARGLPGVTGVVPAADEDLDAVYYDTRDLRLLAHGTTLRRRSGGHDAGWHLKRPLGPDRREEIACPDTGDDVVPEALAVRVKALARGKAVVPVLRMRTRREREHLVDNRGTPLAEVARDHVAAEVLRRPGRITSWSELEVELETGAAEDNGAAGKGVGRKAGAALLDAVEAQLRETGWHRSASSSKTARVFAEVEGQPAAGRPTRAEAARGLRPGSIGRAVHDRIVEQRAALLAADPGVRLDEPEAVHDMRVAARRLRSLLRSYRRFFDRRVTDPLGDELRWLGQTLGEARDHQVLAERIRTSAADLCAADEVTCVELADAASRIDAVESTAYQNARLLAVENLNRKRYFRLLDGLEGLVQSPPLRAARADRDAPKELRRTVRKEHRRLAERVAHAEAAPRGHDHDLALHATRKAAKRARYAAEAAVPVTGAKAERFVKRAKAVQRLLGEHQDTVVARDTLRRLAAEAHTSGADTFAYGLLYAAEQHAAEHANAEFPTVWSKIKPRKLSRIA